MYNKILAENMLRFGPRNLSESERNMLNLIIESDLPKSVNTLSELDNIMIKWTDCGGVDNELTSADRLNLKLINPGQSPIKVQFIKEPAALRQPTDAERAGGETESFSIQRCVIGSNAIGKTLELYPYQDIFYLQFNG